jgi:hypothetical protein
VFLHLDSLRLAAAEAAFEALVRGTAEGELSKAEIAAFHQANAGPP